MVTATVILRKKMSSKIWNFFYTDFGCLAWSTRHAVCFLTVVFRSYKKIVVCLYRNKPFCLLENTFTFLFQ